MKIRSGFVSNSSSSSFVILGFRMPKAEFNEKGGHEFFEEHFGYVDMPEGEDFAIIGHRLGRWSDDGGISWRDVDDLEVIKEDVSSACANVLPEIPPLELIFGTTYG